VEELQTLSGELRQQLMETEQLLAQRMRAVVNGNYHFTPLANIAILQQV
jgi:hypothetical protein